MSNNTIHAHAGFAGRYKIEAFRVDEMGDEIPGSRRVAADWFPNLITNSGLDYLGTDSAGDFLGFCRVGSGNNAPAVSDTALGSQIAVSNTAQSETRGVDRTGTYYAWRRKTFRFSTGTAAGNIAELGVSPAAANALFSRALILDSGGSPTTVTVLSDEVLDVTYEIRLYPSIPDATGSVVIAGVTYSWTARALLASNYDASWARLSGPISFDTGTGQKGAVADLPAQNAQYGSLSAAASMVGQAYTAGSFQRSHVMSFDLNNGNVAGGIGAFIGAVSSVTTASGGVWAWGLSPKLPKTGEFKATFTVRFSWGRYTP